MGKYVEKRNTNVHKSISDPTKICARAWQNSNDALLHKRRETLISKLKSIHPLNLSEIRAIFR